MLKRSSRLLAALLLAALSIPLTQCAKRQDRFSLAGAVKGKSGEPAAGIMVTARDENRGLAVTIISQEGGSYSFATLPPAQYSVRAMGGGFQSDEASVKVAAEEPARQDLLLTTPADFKKAASLNEYATLMPEAEAKTFIIGNCTDCHQDGLQEILYSRKRKEDWAATIELMKKNPYGYFRSLTIADPQKAMVVEYLSKHYGPEAPALDMDKIPRRVLSGAVTKAVATEFDLPAGAMVHDVAVDSKGIAWVGEGGHGVLGRFDPATAAYTRILVPGKNPGATALQIDSQDRVWFGDGPNSRLMAYDPRTGSFTEYSLASVAEGQVNLNTIRFHPDGKVWATAISSNAVISLDPSTRHVTRHEIPYAVKTKKNANPYGMAIDADKNIWFVEGMAQRVAKIEVAGGKVTEYDVPAKPSRMRRMAADNDGNIWFGEFASGNLGMADPKTGEIAEYAAPTANSGPYSVDVDKVTNLIWVNEMMADQIASFNPRTKIWVEYQIPTRHTSVRRISVDPSRPTRIWYAALARDKVGYIDVPAQSNAQTSRLH